MLQEGVKYVFLVLYIFLNVFVLAERVLYYTVVDRTAYSVLNWGVVIARATGAGIKLNSAIILLPVLRNFLSWIRGTFVGSLLPVDKAIIFHIRVAWVIFVLTIVHVWSHYINFTNIEHATDEQLDRLNLARVTAWQLAWTSLPGVTGQIVLVCMMLMYATAVERVRRPHFEQFWYVHHLFILYYVLISIHGAAGLLEFPTFWLWVIVPLLMYFAERTLRFVRGRQNTVLMLAVQHPSKVIELQLKKSLFQFESGQYVFLCCPYIAEHEWHPFTISSAPQDEYLGVHIRVVGDWTGSLAKMLNPKGELGIVRENMVTAPNGMPVMQVDGPFGTASGDIFKYQLVMLVGGGIGVTPFSSILRNIRYRLEEYRNPAKRKRMRRRELDGTDDVEANRPFLKVWFFWISRDKYMFEWLIEQINALELEDPDGIIEINIHLTGISPAAASDKGLTVPDEFGRDPLTGLRSMTQFSRPNFKHKFQEISEQWPESTVACFFCGPPVLSKSLYHYSTKFTMRTTTKFVYHHEVF